MAKVKAKPAQNTAPKNEIEKPNIDSLGRAYGTGRRKNSSARVWVKRGTGKIVVDDRDVSVYFARPVLQMIIRQPFDAIDAAGKYDVFCTAVGGGLSGQANAVRLGIARALVTLDESFRPALRKFGLLTRDPRVVERKKYGMKKARKKFQFSKR